MLEWLTDLRFNGVVLLWLKKRLKEYFLHC